MTSQSIIAITSSLIVKIFYLTTNIEPSLQDNSRSSKELEILGDLPVKDDLDNYLTGLENLLKFVANYRHHTDLAVATSLFFIYINLRLITKRKHAEIEPSIGERCRKILEGNNITLQYFRDMIPNNVRHIKNMPKRSIYNLLLNEVTWTNRLEMYEYTLLKETNFHSKQKLDAMYGSKSVYKNNVENFQKYIPGPTQSNKCITALAQNPINKKTYWTACYYNKDCANYVRNGTDFGYAITHRLLYLLFAKFSIGCTVFSEREDRKNIDRLCSKIYNEAEFIANHDYILLDLFLEQICVCALAGHAQFIRRTWLNGMLKFQDVIGCMRTNPGSKPKVDTRRENWAIADKSATKVGGLCNSHTTGLAAVALSAAIRFILERYS